MITKFFHCTLLSDVILNHSAATEGNQRSLDFIPGNNFLGIAAAALYGSDELSASDKLRLFHSGEVRFGDAHAVVNGERTLRIPASMYYSKLSKVEDGCWIHHGYDRNQDAAKPQLKQCRDGFYTLGTVESIVRAKIASSFAIKSAYDSKSRRSMDSMMYGYDSLNAGLQLAFAVEFDDSVDERLVGRVTESLTGPRHIGRSRTAQYGVVLIEEASADCYKELSRAATSGSVTVYADGRLIFLDEQNGMPTYRPTASQLGLPNGEIDWSLSQVRTFQYAPWNGKRQVRDTDRCGIEKGSVFVVKNATSSPSRSQYVGSYRNEGFGKVVYNPAFLDYSDNGVALAKFAGEASATQEVSVAADNNDPLVRYVTCRKRYEKQLQDIYQLVDEFVEKNASKFGGEQFASQWGTIRSIATSLTDSNKIYEAIFGEKGYLMHGVANEKWNRGGRLSAFKKFVKFVKEEEKKNYDMRLVLVNLAAEMAKKCRKK